MEPLVFTHPEPTSREADFWPTPSWVTEALIAHCPPSRSVAIVEPAIGDGAIAYVLDTYGYRVAIGIDIRRECAAPATCWCNNILIDDFLCIASAIDLKYAIITNPPFSLAQEYVRACRPRARPYTALLLPVSALAGTQEWRSVWAEVGPPTTEVRLLARPKFGGSSNDRLGIIWAIWERGKTPLNVHWI